MIVAAKPPDIVVAGDAGLMAVRLADGRVALSGARKDRFAAGIWLRHFGQAEDSGMYWPREGEGPGGMMCDPYGCRMEKDGRKIAFSLRPDGLAEDCAWADILVARAPLRDMKCAAPLVVDRFDLWRHGAYALWAADARVETVTGTRGRRPWTVSAGR
jgi:competence protein ComEC